MKSGDRVKVIHQGKITFMPPQLISHLPASLSPKCKFHLNPPITSLQRDYLGCTLKIPIQLINRKDASIDMLDYLLKHEFMELRPLSKSKSYGRIFKRETDEVASMVRDSRTAPAGLEQRRRRRVAANSIPNPEHIEQFSQSWSGKLKGEKLERQGQRIGGVGDESREQFYTSN